MHSCAVRVTVRVSAFSGVNIQPLTPKSFGTWPKFISVEATGGALSPLKYTTASILIDTGKSIQILAEYPV